MSESRTICPLVHILVHNKEETMSRLIIDGNAVFEIDEECLQRRRPAPECDIEKYISIPKPMAKNMNDKMDNNVMNQKKLPN